METIDRKKVILHDWDDTIVNTFQYALETDQAFARNYNLRVPTEGDFLKLWGSPLNIFLPQLWPEVKSDEVVKLHNEFVEKNGYCIRPFDYSRQALLKLRENQFLIGVVSSGPRTGMEQTIAQYLDLSPDTFLFIHGGEDCQIHKPDPRVFDPAFKVLKGLGYDESHALYVGDSLKDYWAARDRGMEFHAVITGFTIPEVFQDAGLQKGLIHSTYHEFVEALVDNS